MNETIKFKLVFFLMLLISLLLLLKCQRDSSSNSEMFLKAKTDIEAGRYLVTIGGCNDCHTDGYLQKEGKIPEKDWLTGSIMGWRGPWGTTYASNLRLFVQDVDEDDFVETIKTRKSMPPMPWMNVNKMSEKDARSVYKYIKSLGAKGEEMPNALPPNQVPATPFITLVPQSMGIQQNK